MEITEVRVKLVERSSERLRAFCSVTFDGDFVIRDLKVIDGVSGVFVAMPSRKLSDRCNRCGCKNHLRARFCNECGQRLNENRAPKDVDGRAKLHADIAHPINAECRERIQAEVVRAYQEEMERAKSPDYQPISFDDYDDDFEDRGVATQAKPKASTEVQQDEEASQPGNARDQHDRHRDRRQDRGGQKRRSDDRGRQPAGEANSGETFGDYNDLIADLKREAATRDDRRGGYGRRDRQEVSTGHTGPAVTPKDATARDEANEAQGDFGAGIEAPDRDRGKGNDRGGRPRDDRSASQQGRGRDNRSGRDQPPRDSARRDDRGQTARPETPPPVEDQKPEPPQSKPEPKKVEARPPSPPDDDDFGAGLL